MDENVEVTKDMGYWWRELRDQLRFSLALEDGLDHLGVYLSKHRLYPIFRLLPLTKLKP